MDKELLKESSELGQCIGNLIYSSIDGRHRGVVIVAMQVVASAIIGKCFAEEPQTNLEKKIQKIIELFEADIRISYHHTKKLLENLENNANN